MTQGRRGTVKPPPPSEGPTAAIDVTKLDPQRRKELFHLCRRKLTSEDVEDRLHAIDNLCRLQRKDTTKYLLPLLNDPEPEVRLRTAQALALFLGRSVVPYFEALLDDPALEVRRAGIGMIATLARDEETARILFRGLKDPVEEIRVEAAQALARFPREIVVAPLQEALGDDSGAVRLAALQAIKTLGRG
ncbi:MAG: hypothetical protein D6795_06930 [Deltaproteobacteria bacterium]|nr:MAG: hypothetical protein D6795_06930 [Deltaproteobacteria bacterium]